MSHIAEMSRVSPGSKVPIWRPLDRRARRVMARARLYSELRLIVLDLLGPCEPDELPVEVSAWVDDAAAHAASEVCEMSMRALIRSLESTIEAAPPGFVRRLDQAALRHEVGID